MATSMSSLASLESLLKDNGVDVAVLAELSNASFKITTIKQFANYFESRQEVKSTAV